MAATRRPMLPVLLPPLAIASFSLTVVGIISIAGATLGYDYEAYVAAGRRVLSGAPLYDLTIDAAVGFGVFLYPPPFAVAMVPFAWLPATVALWAWLALIVAAFLAGVAILPVSRDVRWATLLLAAVSWPFLYSIKLGQVGPLLFFGFAAAWRFMERDGVIAAAGAAGAIAKLQPGLLFGWAIARRRWRATLLGLAILAAAAFVTALIVGGQAFADYLTLLTRINRPVTTPQNATPGAIAFQLGVSEGAAGLLQYASMAAVLAVTIWAWFRASAETSLIVTVVASQLLSPVLWDHYAILLLLPTAFLLERRQWWAAAIPLAGWLPLAGMPVVPLVFAVALVAPLVVDRPRRGG